MRYSRGTGQLCALAKRYPETIPRISQKASRLARVCITKIRSRMANERDGVVAGETIWVVTSASALCLDIIKSRLAGAPLA